MRNEILANINAPKELETLYRKNRSLFKREFSAVFPDIADNSIALCWKERLDHERGGISWGSSNELGFVIIASLLAGTIAKVPEFLPVKEEFFYPRNIGFILFPFLMAYFAWKNAMKPAGVLFATIATSIAFIFINVLPGSIDGNASSDTLLLSCIHVPLFLWAVLGFTYVGGERKDLVRRVDFLRYNGDLVVITTLILIAGALMTGLTVALFQLINIQIVDFYMPYVVVYGLAAGPIVGTYVIQSNPQLVNAVSPMIAKLFSPLVLVTLAVYLGAMLASDQDPYNDREFLLTFNLLLIGVMAIILFSVAGAARSATSKVGSLILLLLAVLTIVVNGIALMAILFRISEWGFTPNRLAVLGGNVLILTNLLFVTYRLSLAVYKGSGNEGVERSIAQFLPIYSIWTAIVVFGFPFVFGFE